MTQDEVKQQVMGRVGVIPESVVGLAHERLNQWLAAYPLKFVFGPREVMAGCRMVRRELGLR